MARPESLAVAGYYPTPAHLVPRIAGLFEKSKDGVSTPFSIMDPCAGTGAAVDVMVKTIADTARLGSYQRVYACEMEETRYDALRGLHYDSLHCDAFHVDFRVGSRRGVDVLHLNPPYDTDREFGRLEERFLDRFTPAVITGGHTVFVVPYYALAASAQTLALHYDDVQCYRFPEGDFEYYKQIVLIARRGSGAMVADETIVARVLAWAASADGIPVLPELPTAEFPRASGDRWYSGVDTWTKRALDFQTLLSTFEPWTQVQRGTTIPATNVVPTVPVQDMLLRTYPVATPPRPAHIAAGIAAGIFNGSRIVPNKGQRLPALLVKGVFDREYRTVEEKKNKDGTTKSLVQVQQPRLITTVLDLETFTYHTLKEAAGKNVKSIEDLGVQDLLSMYGTSLMHAMERQCPIGYDPRRDAGTIEVPEAARTPFVAQAHAVRALVRLLGGPGLPVAKRAHKGAFLLGEIGSGKSLTSLLALKACGSQRPLILCPPHLLTSWTNEIADTFPEARTCVLSSPEDVEAFVATPGFCVGVMSRESAKLSHGWVGVTGACPRCGTQVPDGDLAKKRANCEHRQLLDANDLAGLVRGLARKLRPWAPQNATVLRLLSGRFAALVSQHHTSKQPAGPLALTAQDWRPIIAELLTIRNKSDMDGRTRCARAIMFAVGSVNNHAFTVEMIRAAFVDSGYDPVSYMLTSLLPADHQELPTLKEEAMASQTNRYGSWSYGKCWNDSPTIADIRIARGETVLLDSMELGSPTMALKAFGLAAAAASFTWGPVCDEPLFQAIPEPRRIGLAQYVTKKHPTAFDFLIVDECHEYSNEGTAQSNAATRFINLQLPTIIMTGTIMNGYADSMFLNMWAINREFREEFDRDERSKFVDRFGYRKRIVDLEKAEKATVEFGSVTDRVEKSARVTGDAPGVLPLFLLRYLLPVSVTLHKADLAINLPTCTQIRHEIDPTPEQMNRYTSLRAALVQQIKKDRFVPDRAGRLFGQLAELPSYLDRATADTGNCEDGSFEIRYPESLDNELVATQAPFASDVLLPKEQWLVDLVAAELAEGRNVMVFSWHLNLLPRLSRLLEARTGEKATILWADKVPTAKRQNWIDKEIVRKGRRIMCTNPVAIQTGLNNLVHFSTVIWMENPACGPTIYRQAIGRIDRIGQKKETRVHFPVYRDTLQDQMHNLLLRKVAISVSTDGLDPESSLQAAGVGAESYQAGLSIGKELWRLMNESEAEAA